MPPPITITRDFVIGLGVGVGAGVGVGVGVGLGFEWLSESLYFFDFFLSSSAKAKGVPVASKTPPADRK